MAKRNGTQAAAIVLGVVIGGAIGFSPENVALWIGINAAIGARIG